MKALVTDNSTYLILKKSLFYFTKNFCRGGGGNFFVFTKYFLVEITNNFPFYINVIYFNGISEY